MASDAAEWAAVQLMLATSWRNSTESWKPSGQVWAKVVQHKNVWDFRCE